MGKKHKRAQRPTALAKPRGIVYKPGQSQPISLVIAPEQLLKNGDVSKAIEILQAQLKKNPTDEQKRLLSACFLHVNNYQDAADTLLTLDYPTADDLRSAGTAWLMLGEWEQARTAFQDALALEENAETMYLQVLAIKRDRDYYELGDEEQADMITFLQKVCTLPACPADAFLLLDDLLFTTIDEYDVDLTSLFENALQRYPDHTELRVRHASHLLHAHSFTQALVIVEPLLSQATPSQRALSCAIHAAFKLSLFERALMYVEQLQPELVRQRGLGIDFVKGDIYLGWGKVEEAHACYEREIQRNDADASFHSFFRIAKVLLIRDELEKARHAALEGVASWLDNTARLIYGDSLPSSNVAVGEDNNCVYISLYSSDEIVREVCEVILSAEQESTVIERGRLAYLLYAILEVGRADEDNHETFRMNGLLHTMEQGALHPHMGQFLAPYYAKQGNFSRAIQVLLDDFLWRFSAWKQHRSRSSLNNNREHLFALQWMFRRLIEEVPWNQKMLTALSETERERCHATALSFLQAHFREADVVLSICVPFFQLFWSNLLAVGKMHQALVDVTRLLMQAAPNDQTLWWLLAYHLHELEQSEEAEQAYRRYLELVPDSADALHNLSLLVEEKGTLQEALVLSRKAATLDPDDELIVKNSQRLARKEVEQEQSQLRLWEGAKLWSCLSESQRRLLCLLELYPPTHWSGLLPQIKNEEQQLRQLQEDWDHLFSAGACVQREPETLVQVTACLQSFVQDEGFRLWLVTEVARVQIRKKKNVWLPKTADLDDAHLSQLAPHERQVLHQALMRKINNVSLVGLERLHLSFYRRAWKKLLIEWKMYTELVDLCHVFLTRFSAMTREELWECAYYATDLSSPQYLLIAERWYKKYLEQGESHATYHNLAVISFKRNHYQEALYLIEQALTLAPLHAGSTALKSDIEQTIRNVEEQQQRRDQEQQRQKEQDAQYLKGLEQTIAVHVGEVDYFKQKILQALKGGVAYYSKRSLAKELRMEDWALEGHWKKLVVWGMILEQGRRTPTLHPLVASYLEQGWPVPLTSSMKTLVINPAAGSLIKPAFSSKQEYKLYTVLLEIFHGQLVFPNMALQAIFPYAKMKEVLSKEEFSYYMVSSVDICIVRTTSYFPLVAFEVDGPHHEQEERQRKDALKNAIFEKGGLGLIRLQIGYQPLSTKELWEDVRVKINQALYAWRSDSTRQGWIEDLETELGMSRFERKFSEEESHAYQAREEREEITEEADAET